MLFPRRLPRLRPLRCNRAYQGAKAEPIKQMGSPAYEESALPMPRLPAWKGGRKTTLQMGSAKPKRWTPAANRRPLRLLGALRVGKPKKGQQS